MGLPVGVAGAAHRRRCQKARQFTPATTVAQANSSLQPGPRLLETDGRPLLGLAVAVLGSPDLTSESESHIHVQVPVWQQTALGRVSGAAVGGVKMYVCVCKAVSDKELRQIIEGGARSAAEVERSCGAGGDCGSCVGEIEELLAIHQLTRPAISACGRHHRVAAAELSLAA